MGSLRLGRLVCVGITVFLFSFILGCGKGKPAGASPFPARITLTPNPSYSMQVGASVIFFAGAQNASNTNISPTFTYVSSAPAIVDVSPNGIACAGTWNQGYTVCNPGQTGVAQITATALGGTSAPTFVFVHPPIDNIQISVVPPVNSPPPACPTQQELPAACNVKFNGNASNFCLSQNQVQTLQATAYSQGTDITPSVGPFIWSGVIANVVKTTPIVTVNSYNVPTNQVTITPNTPGQTQLVASASGVYSQPYNVETCPVQCIDLQVGPVGEFTGQTSFVANKGTSETLTATVVDVQGCVVPTPPLTWVSTAPAVLSAGGSAGCTAGTTCTVTTTQPGAGAITASCSPPACNVGFPLNPAGFAAGSPYIPGPVYPVTAVSGLVTGTSSPTTVFATTKDCNSDQICSVGLYNVSTSTNVASNAFQLPTPPNSLLFDPAGDKAFMGSEFGAVAVTSANFGTANSPFSFVPALGTPLGLVTGQVLATSQNGTMAIFSDAISTPNQVYVANATSATIPLNINSATAAAFSPDGLKAFILGDGGNSLYIYSPLQALRPKITLPTPATSIVFNSTGTFGLLSGGSASGTLAAYNTCDNSPIDNPALSAGTITTPPLFLKMVPAGNVPLGSTFGNIVLPLNLETAGLDLFFGLDNTGLDIIATTSTLPLAVGSPALAPLCPQVVTLGQLTPLTSPPALFTPVHIDINHGTFHPINFFLSPDATLAYIVTSDFGILVYNFNTNAVSAIPLVNNANPVSADMTADGLFLYVAGSDGLLHEVSTALALDQNQILFPALPNSTSSFCYTGSACGLDLVAVKP